MSKRRRGTRLTFKKPSTTVNSMNEVTGDATEYMKRWGKVTNGKGNESSFGEQMQHVGAVMLETAFPKDGRLPQPEDIVTWLEWGRTRTVNIQHVERRGRDLIIACAEV